MGATCLQLDMEQQCFGHPHAFRDMQLHQKPYAPRHLYETIKCKHQSENIHLVTSTVEQGGASRGAFMAGLIPRFAIDKDLFACESYVSNFPKAQLLRKTISDWLNVEKEALPHVDVLHVSPPCQDFPPANTRKGALRGLVSPEPLPGPFPEDPSCRWAGYESAGETSNVGQILTTLSAAHKAPLAVVLEQTAGLVTHFPDWFQFLITEFANAGCSTISSVLHFQDYGLAQFSKRLVIVATALVYVFSFIF